VIVVTTRRDLRHSDMEHEDTECTAISYGPKKGQPMAGRRVNGATERAVDATVEGSRPESRTVVLLRIEVDGLGWRSNFRSRENLD
jgi:hypothetical protein